MKQELKSAEKRMSALEKELERKTSALENISQEKNLLQDEVSVTVKKTIISFHLFIDAIFQAKRGEACRREELSKRRRENSDFRASRSPFFRGDRYVFSRMRKRNCSLLQRRYGAK